MHYLDNRLLKDGYANINLYTVNYNLILSVDGNNYSFSGQVNLDEVGESLTIFDQSKCPYNIYKDDALGNYTWFSITGTFETRAPDGTLMYSTTRIDDSITTYEVILAVKENKTCYVYHNREWVPGTPYVYTNGGWKPGTAKILK